MGDGELNDFSSLLPSTSSWSVPYGDFDPSMTGSVRASSILENFSMVWGDFIINSSEFIFRKK